MFWHRSFKTKKTSAPTVTTQSLIKDAERNVELWRAMQHRVYEEKYEAEVRVQRTKVSTWCDTLPAEMRWDFFVRHLEALSALQSLNSQLEEAADQVLQAEARLEDLRFDERQEALLRTHHWGSSGDLSSDDNGRFRIKAFKHDSWPESEESLWHAEY